MLKEKKYEMIVRRTKEIINNFSMKLTLRQVYYQLVVSNDIPSNRSQYVYFIDVMTKYRQKNIDFSRNFDDKTRKLQTNISEYCPTESFSEAIENKLYDVKNDYPTFWYNSNLLQDKVCIILLEKQALEGIFESAIGNMSILVVARGFNSFTQMYELSLVLKRLKKAGKELNLYIFTDFDDSGLLIQNNFLNQMRKYLKIRFDHVERVGLNIGHVSEYNLPTNPTKKSTHSKFNLPFFVELDALNPNVLRNMIKDVCNENFDHDLAKAISKVQKIRNRRLKKAYFRKLRKIDLSTI